MAGCTTAMGTGLDTGTLLARGLCTWSAVQPRCALCISWGRALEGLWTASPRAASPATQSLLSRLVGRVYIIDGAVNSPIPITILGTFILFVGFFSFNAGSQLTLGLNATKANDNGTTMSLAMANTILSAAGGGLAAIAFDHIYRMYKKRRLRESCALALLLLCFFTYY